MICEIFLFSSIYIFISHLINFVNISLFVHNFDFV